jgi:multisubunit Na+/H+ antiporter MnhB subunit
VNNALILPFFLFLSVIVISIFSFAAVSLWLHARRGEREAFYKSEIVRRLLEIQTPNATDALEAVHEENRYQSRRRRDRSRLAGLVTGAVGLGLLTFLYAMLRTVTTQPVYLVALIPIFIGGALLLHSFSIQTK